MRILLIEDDLDLCTALKISLEKDGYAMDICNNGSDALQYIQKPFYEVVILDRMLPQQNGISVLQTARQMGIKTPVLMLTALGRVSDRVDGLEAGADDYLVKPFDTRELKARIKALSRRSPSPIEQDALTYVDLTLNLNELELSCMDKTVKLSPKECLLAECLIKNAGTLLSREVLIGTVWGVDDIVEEANLDTYICFLRRRLNNIKSKAVITTVRGFGYRMETKKN